MLIPYQSTPASSLSLSDNTIFYKIQNSTKCNSLEFKRWTQWSTWYKQDIIYRPNTNRSKLKPVYSISHTHTHSSLSLSLPYFNNELHFHKYLQKTVEGATSTHNNIVLNCNINFPYHYSCNSIYTTLITTQLSLPIITLFYYQKDQL